MGEIRPNNAYLGLNLDSITGQVKPGQLTYALNAQLAGFEGNSIIYQNEQANEFCFQIPEGFHVIGTHHIVEIETVIYWLVNPTTGQSEIGQVVNESCIYQPIINGSCLNFNRNYPILKAVHKITNCTVEIYWTDGLNPRRWLDLKNLPYTQVVQGTNTDPCNIVTLSQIDCNKLNIQPNFNIPQITYVGVADNGDTLAGDYQFAVQYCNSLGDPYTSFYSITNPLPVHNSLAVTPDFNYATGKSIRVDISNLDTTGLFTYFNVAVIKTVNNITSVDLVATYQIQGSEQRVLYTGQSKTGITLTIDEIFEKFAIYDTAGDLTTVQDILVWDDLTATERVSYQQIANQIDLKWVAYILPPAAGQFKDELNAANYRGYMRDEVYAFDMVIVLKNGYQSDRFPIPGRIADGADLDPVNNGDTQCGITPCDEAVSIPRWQAYNTASIIDFDPNYVAHLIQTGGSNPAVGGEIKKGPQEGDPVTQTISPCYQGAFEYGDFAYWESTETYPCNEAVWGDLAGKPIRHHKFPDSSIIHHYDASGNIYPLGVRVDMQQVYDLFRASGLTSSQLDRIEEIKIVRGNRANAKSIIAKGMLYNVGVYNKDDSSYFYPNYPYNDLRLDPFIQKGVPPSPLGVVLVNKVQDANTVAGPGFTTLYTDNLAANQLANDGDVVTADYQGTFGNTTSLKRFKVLFDTNQLVFDSHGLNVNSSTSWEIVSTIKRVSATSVQCHTVLTLSGNISTTTTEDVTLVNVNLANQITIILEGESNGTGVADGDIVARSESINYKAAEITGAEVVSPLLNGFSTPQSQERFTFHSPDTSFYQPFLGNILKLETVEYGLSKAHFVQVKNHAKYKFPSLASYLSALVTGIIIGFASGTYGVADNIFNGTAAFTTFTTLKDIIYQLLPRKNFAYQFDSLGNYTNFTVIPNDNGNKIRCIDIGAYLSSVIQGVGDLNPVNNWQRESSVYLRTTNTVPYPDTYPNVPIDTSRFVDSKVGCSTNFFDVPISSYYGSIKTAYPDQYGQIYSYDTVDTGAQYLIDLDQPFTSTNRYLDVFGGDTFINKFAFKRKLPFFIDNRVNDPDDSDVYYDELGNISNPTYWFSTDISKGSGGAFSIGTLFGVKVHNFDCKGNAFFYDSGKIYLFAYGIPFFFVESTVNVDYRQAYNTLEGDYYPHVSGDVPDEWVQEKNVSIAFDNTYTYNKTFSKQNEENVFTTLPIDFIPGQECLQDFPNKAVYSDRQEDLINYKKNNWLIYRPTSFFDFPLNYGKLTSLEGIENRQVLARFENKSMIYNALLTINTSNPQAAYIGNDTLFRSAPPIDFVETDLGYSGSQHKFFLRTEFGNISIDAKRGNVFIIAGSRIEDIGNEGLQRFFEVNLPFQLKIAYPQYPIDNNFKGVGLHGVFDEKYERLIITKLDYRPLSKDITYDSVIDRFTLNGNTIELGDPTYFCNVSWTLSYGFRNKAWLSFHTYVPNYYIGSISKFYAGNDTLGSVWRHNTNNTTYNQLFGETVPYVIEYPFNYKFQDEIVASVKDYTKVNQITDYQAFVQTDDVFFNKAIVYNDQQNSGILNLIHKVPNNLQSYLGYPKYNTDSKDILFVKSDNFYNYNGFWDIVNNYKISIWQSSCNTLSVDKVLNTSNLNYTNRSYKKYQIRAKDCKIRHILDNRTDSRLTSQFIATDNLTSYK